MAPCKMAPRAPSDAELDVEHDCSFFSSSFRGLSRLQAHLLDLPSAASAQDFAKQELERVAYGVCDRREVSFIQGKQHVVKGLYVACHLGTLQCFEAPDCRLLSSGLLNVTGQFTLKAANHVLPVAMLTKRSVKLCWRQVAKVAL